MRRAQGSGLTHHVTFDHVLALGLPLRGREEALLDGQAVRRVIPDHVHRDIVGVRLEQARRRFY